MEKIVKFEIDGKLYWYNKEEHDAAISFQKRLEQNLADFMFYGITKEVITEETFFFVVLKNSKGEIALGKKSRLSGRIFLTKDYEIDINNPIEDTDYKYIRDARLMDI